jgi:hypothetical protein
LVVDGNLLSASGVSGADGITIQGGSALGDAADLHLTLVNNNVTADQYGSGVNVEARYNGLFCASIQNNSIFDGSGGYSDTGLRVFQGETSAFSLERYTGNPSLPLEVRDHLLAENPGIELNSGTAWLSTDVEASLDLAGFTNVPSGFCRVPSF